MKSKIWKYINEFKDREGYPPSYRMIQKHFGFSLRIVQTAMKELKESGHITTIPRKSYIINKKDLD